MKKGLLSKLKIFAGFVILITFSTLLLGCSNSSKSSSNELEKSSDEEKTGDPKYGGTLRVAVLVDGNYIGLPTKQVPAVHTQRQVAPAIETLFRSDKEGNPIPWLAEGYTSDYEAKTITLSLRKGVKFHDGTDFNAEAVKWNLEMNMNAKLGGTENFKSIDVVDDYTVRINLIENDNTIIGNFAYMIGQIISPLSYEKNGEEWAANHPVGTGPFKLVSWEQNRKTVYEKFEDYWQEGKPYLDRIEWTPVQDNVTRLFSLKSGEFDVALNLADKDLEGVESEDFTVTTNPTGAGAVGVVYDNANPNSPFSKLEVRQAVQHAVDTEAIVKNVYYGNAEPANQWIYKGHGSYNPSIEGYPYDPEKAKELLAKAGYPNGFKTKITYIATPEYEQVYTIVQAYLKEVGIEVELEAVLNNRYAEIAYQGGKWEGMLHGSVSGNPDVAGSLRLRYIGNNNYYIQSSYPDDYKKALQNAITAQDLASKQKYTQEAMKLMIDEHALRLVIALRKESAVTHPYVQGTGIFETANSVWWTPEDVWLNK